MISKYDRAKILIEQFGRGNITLDQLWCKLDQLLELTNEKCIIVPDIACQCVEVYENN